MVLQSTLPHGERRQERAADSTEYGTSIHAPARGATASCNSGRPALLTSIHAPARGATFTALGAKIWQPTSIHAPARGATLVLAACPVPGLLQSTLPHGERRPVNVLPMPGTILQSTLPHGERHGWQRRATASKTLQSTLPHGERHPARPERRGLHFYFNPRSRTGSDFCMRRHCQGGIETSIHAPARGATVPLILLWPATICQPCFEQVTELETQLRLNTLIIKISLLISKY